MRVIIIYIQSLNIAIAEGSCDYDPMYRKCLGPTRYYLELKCAPIFKEQKDCCPHYWSCPALRESRAKVCNLNGKAYEERAMADNSDVHPCWYCECFSSGSTDLKP